MKPFLLLFAVTLTAHSEILRLSHVVPEAGSGITRFELVQGDHTSIIFIKDEPILTEADIAVARPSFEREDSIDVTLSPSGAKKMIEATAPMRPGIEQIAIIIDGKVVSAPVVQSVPLGKNFQISGLDDPNEPKKLAARLTGKSEDEIAKEIAENEKRVRELPPLPKPTFHTDEEYKQLKAEREKLGMNYMDRIYTEAELDELLKKGMTEAEVIKIFGKPRSIESEENIKRLTFETAPEKFPTKEGLHLDSFIVRFDSDKVIDWCTHSWSSRTREPKNPSRIPDNLIYKTPPADFSSENFDFVTFVEAHEISLKQGEKKPSNSDYHELLGILWSISSTEDENKSIDSTCDAITFLKPVIPELEALVTKATKQRILLTDLNKALKPYALGDKTWK